MSLVRPSKHAAADASGLIDRQSQPGRSIFPPSASFRLLDEVLVCFPLPALVPEGAPKRSGSKLFWMCSRMSSPRLRLIWNPRPSGIHQEASNNVFPPTLERRMRIALQSAGNGQLTVTIRNDGKGVEEIVDGVPARQHLPWDGGMRQRVKEFWRRVALGHANPDSRRGRHPDHIWSRRHASPTTQCPPHPWLQSAREVQPRVIGAFWESFRGRNRPQALARAGLFSATRPKRAKLWNSERKRFA